MVTRTHGARVKQRILEAGVALWPRASSRAIGRAVGLSHTAVLYHWNGIEGLEHAIAAHAVEIGDMRIVPVLITTKHPAAAKLTGRERSRYLAG